MASLKYLRPFKLLKPYMPKSLYVRILLILIAPLLLATFITMYIFFDHHLDSMTRRLASDITNEISSIIDLYESEAFTKYELQAFTKINYDMSLDFIPLEEKPEPRILRTPVRIIGAWFLDESLESKLPYSFETYIGSSNIYITIELPSDVLQFTLNRKRLLSKTTSVYLMWMLGLPIFLLVIAALFIRNQVRPIRALAKSAERFGKGLSSPEMRPIGAIEVRQAMTAFNRMRERIQRQITQRTEMLAGVSHDLRTPLTRMELELAMLEDTPEIEALRKDVKDMRHMVDSYLAFAKGEQNEVPVMTNLFDLIEAVAEPYRDKIEMPKRKSLRRQVKAQSLKRCFHNLIENAYKYSNKVTIDLNRDEDKFIINIDDDGPGIPEDKREEVFQPFYRLDHARNLDQAGTGLGLSIAQDVISQHGGLIKLEESSTLGGLRVSIELPS